MKTRQLKTFVSLVVLLAAYGAFLTYETKETNHVVVEGVAAKDSTISTLTLQNHEVKQQALTATRKVTKVADSVAVVIQQKEELIDSLIHHTSNEKIIVDSTSPTTIGSYLAEYKPDTITLADGSKIF